MVKPIEHDKEKLYEMEVHSVKNLEADYQKTLEELDKVSGVHILFKDDEQQRILALIDTYLDSVKIGSKNWCISSVIYGGSLGEADGIRYWNMYVQPGRKQFFVWDFKQTNEKWKLVGTTTNVESKNFYCAYNYPNIGFDMEEYITLNEWDRSLFFEHELLK